MFGNLNAEQARRHMSDGDTAKMIGLKRVTYQKKKTTGAFKLKEIRDLCELFNCSFEYLFKIDSNNKSA